MTVRFGVVAAVLFLSVVPAAASSHDLANGMTVRIHGADEILDDAGLLAEAAGGPYVLQSDPEAWYPLDETEVLAALRDMRGFQARVDVDVYILPTPPVAGGRSWSTRNAIFLVPGFGPVAAQTVAYIATHEMGHVLTWAFMDDYPDRWAAYLDLRGISEAAQTAGVPHAWLPREILAEDLRYLFGGALATASGSIENHDLPTPDMVVGLRELLAGYLVDRPDQVAMARSCAYPNPCNPRTTIRMALPGGTGSSGPADLRIYDLRGALVRHLVGGSAGPGTVEMRWDGKDGGGSAAASGRYLYVMKAGGLVARGAVTLVR